MREPFHVWVDISNLKVTIYSRGIVFYVKVAKKSYPRVLSLGYASTLRLLTKHGQQRMIPRQQLLKDCMFQLVETLHKTPLRNIERTDVSDAVDDAASDHNFLPSHVHSSLENARDPAALDGSLCCTLHSGECRLLRAESFDKRTKVVQ